MGERKTAILTRHQVTSIERMVETGEADSDSEAIKIAVGRGLRELGYDNGKRTDTSLRQTARRFRDAFALLTLFLIGVTFWLPLELRGFVAAPLAAALACEGLDRLLARREPGVSNWLAGLVGGERV